MEIKNGTQHFKSIGQSHFNFISADGLGTSHVFVGHEYKRPPAEALRTKLPNRDQNTAKFHLKSLNCGIFN